MTADITVLGSDTRLGRILNRDYIKLYTSYIEVGPEKIVLPVEFVKYYDQIKNFEVRDDDVFILAFPKTGSRWTQEMVWLLLNNLDFKTARDVSLTERSSLLETQPLLGKFIKGDYLQALADSSSPRCIRSHLHWTLLPNEISNGAKLPKILVVLRDPADTCDSYYHQANIFEGYTGTYNDFCDLFLGGKVPLGPYWKHLMGFWEQRHRPNIMFVKYSKMKTELAASIRDVAAFLDKRISEDDVVKMCEHLTFDSLKENAAFNMQDIVKDRGVNPFIRTGRVGGHRNTMSQELVEEFRKQTEQNLKGTELTFD